MLATTSVTVGERSRNSKFSYVSPRSIYVETSNDGKESASTYPCRSLCGSVQENGVEGVVLVVIQITGDPSAERTAPPCSTHVQPDDISHALIQQGEKERLGKTPSSSSTTEWWWWRSAGLQQGFAKHYERRGGRGVGLRQQGEKITSYGQPQTSSIYRGRGGAAPPPRFPPLGVAASPRSHLGGRPRGERGGRTTRWALGPSEPRVSPFPPFLRPGPLVGGGAPAHLGLVPSHTWPTQPFGAGSPTWWTRGTLPMVPVRYR